MTLKGKGKAKHRSYASCGTWCFFYLLRSKAIQMQSVQKPTVNMSLSIGSPWHSSDLFKYTSVGLPRVQQTAGTRRFYATQESRFRFTTSFLRITEPYMSFHLQGKHGSARQESSCCKSFLEGVLFAPWKSPIKCVRQWRFPVREFLVPLMLPQATRTHDLLGPEMLHEMQRSCYVCWHPSGVAATNVPVQPVN